MLCTNAMMFQQRTILVTRYNVTISSITNNNYSTQRAYLSRYPQRIRFQSSFQDDTCHRLSTPFLTCKTPGFGTQNFRQISWYIEKLIFSLPAVRHKKIRHIKSISIWPFITLNTQASISSEIGLLEFTFLHALVPAWYKESPDQLDPFTTISFLLSRWAYALLLVHLKN